jgi:hypothetical protein
VHPQVLCVLVAHDEARQRFLRAAGALPILERLTLTRDWGPTSPPKRDEGGSGGESPEPPGVDLNLCVATQSARLLALLAADSDTQVESCPRDSSPGHIFMSSLHVLGSRSRIRR